MEKEKFGKQTPVITRTDTCPRFSERRSLFAIEPICWFCKYAGFDLNDDRLPERGVCCYPKKQNE